MEKYEIDPHELGLLTEGPQKEYLALFALLVGGGKTAWVQKQKLDVLLDSGHNAYGMNSPFGRIMALRTQRLLQQALQKARTGQYVRLLRSLTELTVCVNHWQWSRDEWTNIHGVGLKTASFITMYTRQDPGPIAVLDTWVLEWLRKAGHRVDHKSTPGSAKIYSRYEGYFVREANDRGMHVRELDQLVWRASARRGRKHE